MKSSNAIRLAVRKAIYAGAAVTAAASLAPVAMAQDEGAGAVEEIVVTGSRIAKKDFTSNAPVATVDAEQIQLTNTVNHRVAAQHVATGSSRSGPYVQQPG